jgi:hypothetical protein
VRRTLEVDESIANICLRIDNGAVVDRRRDLLDEELEDHARLELADILIEVFSEIAFDGSNGVLPRINQASRCGARRGCRLVSFARTPTAPAVHNPKPAMPSHLAVTSMTAAR